MITGREPASEGDSFHEQIRRSADGFGGPFAIGIARGTDRLPLSGTRLRILVPITGTPVSRKGAELALALAQASHGSVTVLHVDSGRQTRRSWQRKLGAAMIPLSSGEAIVREIVRLGDHYGVEVRGLIRHVASPQDAILNHLNIADYNLLVLGVSPRPGEQLFFGQVPAELLERVECSVLFVATDPVVSMDTRPDMPALRRLSTEPPQSPNSGVARPPVPEKTPSRRSGDPRSRSNASSPMACRL